MDHVSYHRVYPYRVLACVQFLRGTMGIIFKTRYFSAIELTKYISQRARLETFGNHAAIVFVHDPLHFNAGTNGDYQPRLDEFKKLVREGELKVERGRRADKQANIIWVRKFDDVLHRDGWENPHAELTFYHLLDGSIVRSMCLARRYKHQIQ